MADAFSVTAAIPCHNGERFIATCIRSILNQTQPPDEILVADDCSTDQAPQIAETFSAVSLVRYTKDLGPGQARDTALHEGKGDIIVYLDADAVLAPDCVAALLREHERGVEGNVCKGKRHHSNI